MVKRSPAARGGARPSVGILLATGVLLAGLSQPVQADNHETGDVLGFHDHFGVFLARSVDGGLTFGEPANVDDDIADSTTPGVAAADGVVHVSWKTGEQPREIAYRRSGDGGSTFGRTVNVSDNEGDSAESDVAVADDRVIVVWADNRLLPDNETRDLRYLRSDEVYARVSETDRARFTTPRNVSNTQGGHSRDPDLDGEGSLAVVVFEDVKESGADGIFVNRSTDEGRTWSRTPIPISGEEGRQTEPSVAVSEGRVHVAWEDESGQLGYGVSSDGGATWESPVLLPELPDSVDGTAAIAAAEDRVHVVVCADGVLHHLGSADGGQLWSEPSPLSSSEGCGGPAVVAHDDGVYTAWEAGTDDFTDIAFRHSTDGGASFSPERNVSGTPGTSIEPSLAVDRSNGEVFLAWADTLKRPDADTPAISIGHATVQEPVEDTATATFEVTLGRPSEDEVTVQFFTVDGTAVVDDDYLAVEGMLVFPAGETSKTIDVVVQSDEEAESDETFEVVLSNPQIGVVVEGRGVGTILDAAP